MGTRILNPKPPKPKPLNPFRSLSDARSLVPAAVALSQKTALQDKRLGFKHTQVKKKHERNKKDVKIGQNAGDKGAAI
jgi:hypothetical protein